MDFTFGQKESFPHRKYLCDDFPDRPGFNNYHKITVRDHSRTCVKMLVYVTYLGKCQKACIRCYTIYLVIFWIIFSLTLLFKYDERIANSAKTDIEVLLKKIYALTLRIQKICCQAIEECQALLLFLFFVTFNIIITSYILPGNFIEFHQVSHENFYFFHFIVNF